jgi:hypothetical protein
VVLAFPGCARAPVRRRVRGTRIDGGAMRHAPELLLAIVVVLVVVFLTLYAKSRTPPMHTSHEDVHRGRSVSGPPATPPQNTPGGLR